MFVWTIDVHLLTWPDAIFLFFLNLTQPRVHETKKPRSKLEIVNAIENRTMTDAWIVASGGAIHCRRSHPLSTYLVTQLAYVGFKAPKERESTRDIEAWEPGMLSVRGKRLNAYEKRSSDLSRIRGNRDRDSWCALLELSFVGHSLVLIGEIFPWRRSCQIEKW